MKHILTILICLTFSTSVCAFEVNSTFLTSKQIPHDIKVVGKTVAASRWSDKTGDNLVILSTDKIVNSEDEREEALYVSAYRKYGDKWKPTWHLLDYVEPCQEDVVCDFVKGTLEITDLNKNGVAEVSFIYRLGCFGDTSGWYQKLFLVDDGKKYPLRGWIEADYDENGVVKESSQMKIDRVFKSAPPGFQKYAVSKWNKNISKSQPNY